VIRLVVIVTHILQFVFHRVFRPLSTPLLLRYEVPNFPWDAPHSDAINAHKARAIDFGIHRCSLTDVVVPFQAHVTLCAAVSVNLVAFAEEWFPVHVHAKIVHSIVYD
jgi:hypothetical protein